LKQFQRIIIVLFAALAIWFYFPVDGPRYEISEIYQPGLTFQTVGSDINDKGEVIGEFYGPSTKPDHAYRAGLYIFSNDRFSEIKLPIDDEQFAYIYAKAINNKSDVVGTIQTRPNQGPSELLSFLYRNGVTRTDLPWSKNYLVIDINDEGLVVAEGTEMMSCEVFDFAASAPPPAPIATKMSQCSKPSTLMEKSSGTEKLIGPDFKRATALNNAGQVIFIRSSNGHYHENAINDQGEIAGQRWSNGKFAAFVSKNGQPVDLPTKADQSEAVSINNAGDIIGRRHNRFFYVAQFGGNFLYSKGKMHDLNRIAGFRFASYEGFKAVKINNRGQILANIQVDGKPRAIVLTPK
jgi:hypothetical protein